MKTIHTLTIVAVALALAGCAKQKKAEEVAECVFPQTTAKAPAWVCSQGSVEGVTLWATGSYQKTAAGAAFQQDQATLNGRVRLAQQIRTTVTGLVKNAMQTTGSGNTETVDQVASSTARSVTAETISGSRVFRTAYAPDGTMFVLVGVDQANLAKTVQQAAQTSMNNDRATWQKVEGAKLMAELNAEVYKLQPQGMR
jgi:hypothetical protein